MTLDPSMVLSRLRNVLRDGLVAAILAGAVGFGVAAEAQQPTPSRANQRPAARQIRIGEFKIEGQIQKPQAFYILQRSNLNFEGLELKNSFVPKIIKSVEQAPF